MGTYISGGFDLRCRVDSLPDDPSLANQFLLPEVRNRMTTDALVWPRPPEVDEFLYRRKFSYPLGLMNDLDEFLIGLHGAGVETENLTQLCVTVSETTAATLCAEGWDDHFSGAPSMESLAARGWRFLGFDVAELNGLCSGLKGIGYKEPTWSSWRSRFGGGLNEVGLFSDDWLASQFAEVRGLDAPSHAPFAVVGILVRD